MNPEQQHETFYFNISYVSKVLPGKCTRYSPGNVHGTPREVYTVLPGKCTRYKSKKSGINITGARGYAVGKKMLMYFMSLM